MNLNKIFLIGRLTRDPETRTTPSGQMVCNFGLATNRYWNDKGTNQRKEETEYTFEGTAEEFIEAVTKKEIA